MTLKLGPWILVVNLYNRKKLQEEKPVENIIQRRVIKTDNGQDIVV